MNEVKNMKVKEVIEKLKEYNPEAEFCIVCNNQDQEFEWLFGIDEGCKKENCQTVDLFVKGFNKKEQ